MSNAVISAAATGLPTSRPNRRGVLQGLAVLPLATAPAVAGTVPDAAILALGHDLERAVTAWRAHIGIDTDEITDRCYDLCSKIEISSAVTLEGLRVKALAFSFYYADAHDGRGADPLGSDAFLNLESPAGDVRMVLSILQSLLDGKGYNEPATGGDA